GPLTIPPSCRTGPEAKYRVVSDPPLTVAAVSFESGVPPTRDRSLSKNCPPAALKSPTAGEAAPNWVCTSAAFCQARAPISDPGLTCDTPMRWVAVNCGAPVRPRLVVISTTPFEAFEP